MGKIIDCRYCGGSYFYMDDHVCPKLEKMSNEELDKHVSEIRTLVAAYMKKHKINPRLEANMHLMGYNLTLITQTYKLFEMRPGGKEGSVYIRFHSDLVDKTQKMIGNLIIEAKCMED